jgi:hypothetical protein
VEQANRRRREEAERQEAETHQQDNAQKSSRPSMRRGSSESVAKSMRNILGGSSRTVDGDDEANDAQDADVAGRAVRNTTGSLKSMGKSVRALRRSSGTVAESELPDHGKRGSVSSRMSYEEEAEEVDDVYYDENEKVLKELPKGSFFGEVALLLSVKRTANVRSVTFSELCILDRDVFARILGGYTEDQQIMSEMILSKYENQGNVMAEIRKAGVVKMPSSPKSSGGSDGGGESQQDAASRSNFEMSQRLENKMTEMAAVLERTQAQLTFFSSQPAEPAPGKLASDMGPRGSVSTTRRSSGIESTFNPCP